MQSENERRLATLLSNLPGMAYRCKNDKDWTLEFVSDGCEALTGYSASVFLGIGGRSYNSLIHPDDRDLIWNEVQDAVSRHEAFRVTYRILAADGREKWVWEQGVGVFAGDDLQAIEGFITDITERKLAENAVRRSEQKFSSAFRSSFAAMSINDLLEDGRFLEVNEAFERITGYRRDEVIGRTVTEIALWADPNEQLEALELFRAEGRIRNLEHRFRKSNGDVGTGLLSLEPLSGGEGLDVLVTTVDITARKQMESALRESEEKFTKAFLSSPAATTIADMDDGGRLIEVNEAFERIVGYRRGEVVGRTVAEIGLWVDPAEHARRVKEFLAAGRIRNVEFQFRKKCGDVGTGLISADFIELNGRVCAITASIDITEHKHAQAEKIKLEEQLREAQRLESVGRLAGGVAHDFNNLITVINGYSDLLINNLGTGDPRRPLAEEISKAGQRAASLTNQLLAVGRKQILQPKVLDLNAIVREIERTFGPLVGAGIEFVITLEAGLGHVMADSDQIHQVLTNLVLNARDAMPAGGRLEIATKNVVVGEDAIAAHHDATPGNYVAVKISDSGGGMDNDTLQRLFEPYFSTKEHGKGTGLGLSSAYGIVRQSGGWIDVSSEPGKGAAFTIYLPRIVASPISNEKASTATERGGVETVLVVEDQDGVRELTKAILKSRGYNVLEASDGETALLLAKEHPGEIRLLLTDVLLPGMNGKELSKQLTAMRPGLKVLFMSGFTEELSVQQGVLDYGVAYIPKPFSLVELAAKVRAVLTDPSRPR